MNVHRLALLGTVAFLCVQAWVAALDIDVDDGDIRRASEIALRPESARAKFHELYNIRVDDPAVERLEIITEFRRYVMEAERQNLLGNWMMARGGYDSKGRTLKDLLRASRGQVAIRVQIRLHPLHTYSAPPPFDIVLGDLPLLPVSVARTPVTQGSHDAGTSLSGAIIETAFNAPSIGGAMLPVQIVVDGKPIARVKVDFARLE